MAKSTRRPRQRPTTISPRLRPAVWSALLGAVTAAAFAAPVYADPSLANGVPDPGARPAPSGALRLPGATVPPAGLTAPPPVPVDGPLAAQITALQYEVATLGTQLLTLEETHDTAVSDFNVADQALRIARTELARAQEAADLAAADALKQAAGLPAGEFGSDLHGLGALSRLKRGEQSGGDTTGPARELTRAKEAEQAAYQVYLVAEARVKASDSQFAGAQGNLRKRETALEELRTQNRAQLIEIERAQEEADQKIGDLIGTGGVAGMVAHPRAMAAVRYALAQRGDPYLWGAEGPDRFDCSGLMWAAYRSKGADYFQLPRVAKDQYYATRHRTVDRRALLPGDLIFFNSGSHWSTVHHVGMYIGDGKMVNAPTSGDVVRIATVRWTSFYQATRIFDPVKAPTTPAPTTPAPTTPAPTTPAPTTPAPTTPAPTTPAPTTGPTTRPPTSPPPTIPPPPPTPTPQSTPPTPTPPAGTNSATAGDTPAGPSRSATTPEPTPSAAGPSDGSPSATG